MAEILVSSSSSDSEPDGPPKKPPPKRRRLFPAAAVRAVPVYSNKVQNSLQLFPEFLKVPVQVPLVSSLPQSESDEEEEVELLAAIPTEQGKRTPLSPPPPSPPPPAQPRKQRHEAKILDQRLRNLKSTLSAVQKSLQDEDLHSEDDVILIDSPEPTESQELVLKIRCRTDLYRVPIQRTDPLQRVVEHMGQMLKVHPSRILLLLRDRDLAAEATPHQLGLGVADIIDCVVEMTSKESDDVGSFQLRVQGKDKSSHMEITIHRNEPLQTLMSRYRQAQGLGRRKLAFYYDGQRLAENWTPEEVGMECGDVIEVWN